MTSYSHTISLGDYQIIALRRLLEELLSAAEQDATVRPKGPDRHLYQNLLGALGRAEVQMASTSSFCWPDGKVPPDAFKPFTLAFPRTHGEPEGIAYVGDEEGAVWELQNGQCRRIGNKDVVSNAMRRFLANEEGD